MSQIKCIKSLVLFTLTPLVLSPAIAQNLLTNGSFETAIAIAPNATLAAGATNLTGWTVIGGGNLLWCDSGPFCARPASTGTFSLDLTGLTNSAPYAGVSQSIVTAVGLRYQFTFDLAGRSDSIPVAVQATAGSTTGTFGNSTATWSSRSLDFTATSVATVISILGVSAGGTGLIIQINNASVVPSPIPEPSQWLLLACGGFAVLGVTRVNKAISRRRLPAEA